MTKKIHKPTMADIMALSNPLDGKFDTGMTVREAMYQAEQWWKNKGQDMMRLHQLRQKHDAANSTPGLNGQFADLDPDSGNYMPSGIINAKPWDDLDKREKLYLIKTWHHIYIRVPHEIEPNSTIQ